ncbi:MAG TPA: DUF2076 domain-containing protein [Bradyrhizobium sp.]|uniref:DUF2076 domain-containing protein n=1 Tax=Bradyrhizobium sp. TaxID=376 RepID=UPI002D7FF4CE|nr:DUF2076 domain-containing protein [Bradyrhizobium sp.]HET7889686.1 DUF2076 domain-containing protein [Bradyrhizobium sp.]
MTPQERQLVDELFNRLSKMESAPRDADATAAITQGLRIAPNAIYPLVQTVLVQDEALRRANDRIQQLEDQLDKAPQQNQGGGGFLDSMRGAIFGQNQSSSGSVPNVRPPDLGGRRPVWNSGQVLQQSGQQYDDRGYGQSQGGYGQSGYGQSYGGPQSPMGGGMMGGMGGGGSFLGTAAAAAAGTIGGSLLLNSIRGMMGGGHHAFGDASLADRATGASPWTDNSNSSLARDAGLNDIGSTKDLAAQDYAQDLAQDQEDDLRAADERDDLEADANDDFGGNDDSDFA